MKILLVNPFSFAYQGGVQEHVKALYRFLKTRKFEVKIIAPRQSKEEYYGEDFLILGYSVVIPGNDSRVSLSYCPPWELEEVISRERFDLIHFHSFFPFLPFQVLNSEKTSGVVKIITSHSNNEGSFFSTTFGGIVDLVVDSFISGMDGIICVSQAATKLIKHYQGRKVIIPNGVDLTRFNPQVSKIDKYLDGKTNILFVGRLDRRKGLQYLLPAFRQLREVKKDVRLIVVGAGFLELELKREASRMKIEDIVFIGEVKAEEIPRYFATADIFCAPSIRGETFGMILLEAMACGVPVVATNIEGYREVMPTEYAPYLVNPEKSDEISAVLKKFIEDERLRQHLGESGMIHAKKYDWESVGSEILEFYREAGYTKGAAGR